MYDEMLGNIREEVIKYILNVEPKSNVERKQVAKVTGASGASDGTVQKKPVVKGEKVGRNDPCPCGSGKKYKKCCGSEE